MGTATFTAEAVSREHPAPRLAAALLLGVMAMVAAGRITGPAEAQVVVPPTAQTVEVPTQPPVPTAPPPTAVPPTKAPTTSPDHRREQPSDSNAADHAPAPATLGSEGSAVPLPTRTRRPTRTPRTGPVLTPTPGTVGVLRLTLSVEPPMPVPGQAMTMLVALANRGDGPASSVTVQAVLPADVNVSRIEPGTGQTARSGPVVRWYIPELDAGAETVLRLGGALARSAAGSVRLCVSALSAAAPLEQCALFQPSFGEASDQVAATIEPLGDGPAPSDDSGGALTARTVGLALLLFGLGAIGVLLGVQLREGKRPRTGG